jgi:hypothetical protein
MNFHTVTQHLPFELQVITLQKWIGPQRIEVDELVSPSYRLSYTTPSTPNSLAFASQKSKFPEHLRHEYEHIRILSWLKDQKIFEDPYTFYMGHFFMSKEMHWLLGEYLIPRELCWDSLRDPNARITYSTTWPITQNPSRTYHLCPNLTHLHGLENVKLNFDAEQYFALFDVALPPFDYHDDEVSGDNLYSDARCHGAAAFLAHTKDLEIHFGVAYKSANPWANVAEGDWCEEWEYKEARLRPFVCESGMVVDWILEHAWHGQYLQHIETIKITGDVQDWVKEKWHSIFVRQAEYKKEREEEGEEVELFAIHEPDMDAMQIYGRVEEVLLEPLPPTNQPGMDSESEWGSDAADPDGAGEAEEDDYRAQDHYPPACTCAIGCWRLRGGKVEEDLAVKSWDEFEKFPEEVVGGWMDGGELWKGGNW